MTSSEDDSPIELHTPPQFYDGGWDSDSCDLDKIKDLCTIADEDEADNSCIVTQNQNQKQNEDLNTEDEKDRKTDLHSRENSPEKSRQVNQVEGEAVKNKDEIQTQNSNKEIQVVDNSETLQEEYTDQLRPLLGFNDKPAIFKIYPVEAGDWKLGDWIKLCGGICLKDNEDNPFAIPIIDLLWCQENNIHHFVKPVEMQRRDFFESRFIYDTYTKDQIMNLNFYKTGTSLLPEYDANLILQQKLSWHEIISASSSTAFTDKEINKNNDNDNENKESISSNQKSNNKESDTTSTNEEEHLPHTTTEAEAKGNEKDNDNDKENPTPVREKSPGVKEFKIKRSQLRNPPGRRPNNSGPGQLTSTSPSHSKSSASSTVSTSTIPAITTLSEARRVGLQLAERLKEQAKQKKKTLAEKDPLSLSPEDALMSDESSMDQMSWTVSKETVQMYFNDSNIRSQPVGNENPEKQASKEHEKEIEMITAGLRVPPSSSISSSPRSNTNQHQLHKAKPKRITNPNTNTKKSAPNSSPRQVQPQTCSSESGNLTDASQKMRRRGPTYSYEESMALLQYVCTNELHDNFQQNRVWQDFEILNIVPNRSWQSLKEHFRRKIYENLPSFGCSEEDMKKFDEAKKNREERQKNGQRNRSKKPQKKVQSDQ